MEYRYRIEPTIGFLLHHEQAGLRYGRSTEDQTNHVLSQEIENRFSAKTGAVFIDLTVRYGTKASHAKLLRLIPDKHMKIFIMELIQNCSFTLTAGSGPNRRFTTPKKIIFHKDRYCWHLQHLHIRRSYYHCEKFSYEHVVVITHVTSPETKMLEEVLSKTYQLCQHIFKIWKLKLRTAETVSAFFCLNNREENRELNVTVEDCTIPSFADPLTYLGVKLYRMLLKTLVVTAPKTNSMFDF